MLARWIGGGAGRGSSWVATGARGSVVVTELGRRSVVGLEHQRWGVGALASRVETRGLRCRGSGSVGRGTDMQVSRWLVWGSTIREIARENGRGEARVRNI